MGQREYELAKLDTHLKTRQASSMRIGNWNVRCFDASHFLAISQQSAHMKPDTDRSVYGRRERMRVESIKHNRIVDIEITTGAVPMNPAAARLRGDT